MARKLNNNIAKYGTLENCKQGQWSNNNMKEEMDSDIIEFRIQEN